MPLSRCLPLLVATLALGAAEAPLVELGLPDLERSRSRFDASLYGQVWLAEDASSLRAHLAELLAATGSRLELDPLALWHAGTGLDLQLLPPDADGEPQILLQLRGADLMAPLSALLRRQGIDEAAPGEAVDHSGFATIGDALVLGSDGTVLRALEPLDDDADLVLRWDREAILAALAAEAAASDAAAVALVEDLLPTGRITGRFSERGLRQRLELGAPPAGLAPIDRAVLASLPPDLLAAYAVGLDGGAWWAAHGEAVMAVVADQMGSDRAAAEQQVGAMIGALGIQGGLGGLAATVDGTALVLVHGGGALIPGLSVALPRSAGLDTMITLGLGMAGMLVPAEGQQRFLVLRGLGDHGQDLVPGVAIARDAGHWWLSTDPVFLAARLAGEGGGWDRSPMGAAILAAAGDQASILGATDAPALLRSLVPLAILGGSWLDQGAHVDALGRTAIALARAAGYDTVIGQPAAAGDWSLEIEGALAGVSYASPGQIGILAAIAIPNLLESRIAAQEATAAATLRSGVFTAQETWRASAHNDLDQDNRGEYGFLPQFSGTVPGFGTDGSDGVEAGTVELLGAQFTGPDAVINGYRFQVFLPDGWGRALPLDQWRARIGEHTPEAINEAERYWVAYAWPDRPGKDGRRVFAMTQGGTVLVKPADEVELPPKWNALFGGREGPAADLFRAPDWLPQ